MLQINNKIKFNQKIFLEHLSFFKSQIKYKTPNLIIKLVKKSKLIIIKSLFINKIIKKILN